MENKNCEAKKRILSQTKFLNQILNFQTKIQRCVELMVHSSILLTGLFSRTILKNYPKKIIEISKLREHLKKLIIIITKFK